MISIIIPARNARDTLRILLDSIRSSSYKEVETIVVDDASTDGTGEVARELRAKVIRLEERSGPAVARNRGAQAARGDILLFLDSDVRLKDDTLRHIAERFSSESELNCLVGIYSKTPLNKGLFSEYKALLCYYWFKDAEGMESFETSCGAIRRAVFNEMGGFDTKYTGAEVEDYEFGYRLGRKYEVVLDTTIQLDHRFPGFALNAKNFFNRGRLWFKLFLKRRRFDSAGSSPSEAAGTVAALPLAGAALYAISGGRWGAHALALSCALYLLVNGRFFIYCFREKGILFSLFSIPVHFANSLVVLAGVFSALIPHGPGSESRRTL